MDEQYLQMLMELLAAQQGGGMPMGDPGLAYGPGGRVPQYRTQYTGFMSDGTVRDLLQRAMVNQDQFSADALISLRPELKPLVSRAVYEAGHDPYGVYALFDDDPFRRALLDIALRQEGAQPPQIDFEGGGYADVNDDGRVDVEDLTYDQYMDAVLKQYADQQKAIRTGQVDMFGDGVSINRPYMDVLQERLADYQSALDDFVTQASPTAQRNMNQIEALWEGLGGMPFPGMGLGAPTYDGVGPAFQGENNGFAGSPSGREPAALRELREVQAAGGNAADLEEFTRRYLARHGVDFAANRAERDRVSRKITEGRRRFVERYPHLEAMTQKDRELAAWTRNAYRNVWGDTWVEEWDQGLTRYLHDEMARRADTRQTAEREMGSRRAEVLKNYMQRRADTRQSAEREMYARRAAGQENQMRRQMRRRADTRQSAEREMRSRRASRQRSR